MLIECFSRLCPVSNCFAFNTNRHRLPTQIAEAASQRGDFGHNRFVILVAVGENVPGTGADDPGVPSGPAVVVEIAQHAFFDALNASRLAANGKVLTTGRLRVPADWGIFSSAAYPA